MKSLEAHLAEIQQAELIGEARVEWALDEGLDPDAPETIAAFEEKLEEDREAFEEARAEARMDW